MLLHAFSARSRCHDRAKEFLRAHVSNGQFLICELVLVELYVLLRNPAVVESPLSAERAVNVCRKYRQNRYWAVVDYPGGLMHDIWQFAAQKNV